MTTTKQLVSFRPSTKQINEVKEWLIAENELSGDGFFCNWDSIYASFKKKELATISVSGEVIGFITWRYTSDFTARIDFAEVKPSYRSKGFGRTLVRELLEKLVSKGIYVVDLQCSPATSETIWKRFGFTDFPDDENWSIGNKKLFKILVPYLEQVKELDDTEEFIEIWQGEEHATRKIDSKWKWRLDFIPGTRKLKKPIIQPAFHKWRIRWKSAAQLKKDTSIKYFLNRIDFCSFLIIQEIPA